jgi:Gpi18-like mannosyltransferase
MAFVMLGNTEERGYYATMYNDEIMILYLILSVYYVLKNRPILASVFFTLGLSVKAGLILLIPSFFG